MSEKTKAFMDRAKEQTIGCEIEMAEITRNTAIKVVARYFGTLETVHHDGGSYDAWSCKDTQGRTWKVMRYVSISASTDTRKAELVTPILRYNDLEDLQEIVRQLRHKGGVSNPEHSAGVHIHIGAQGQTPQSLRTLANLMSAHEKLLAEAINIDSYRQHRYCRTVNPEFLKELNKRKPTTMSELADIWYTSHGASYGRSQHYNSSRYAMLNYHSVFTHGTIEYRLWQFDNPTADRKGGLNAGQLKAYIQFSIAITQMAKELKSASPKEQQKENKKFAMRTWLNRLGLVGEEYSTLRMVFTRRLDGNAAFRFGA